jgi:hypothetical protein
MARADLVEQQTIDLLNHLVLPRDLLDEVVSVAETMIQPNATPHITSEQIDDRLRRLGVSYRLGDLSDDDYLAERGRLQALRASANVSTIVLDLRRAAQSLSTLGDWLAAANSAEQRIIVRQIFSRVWVDKEGLKVIQPTTLYRPLLTALEGVCEGCLMGVRLAPHTPKVPLQRPSSP